MNGNNRPLYDFESCREIDRLTIARGFAEVQLMGQAALASLYRLFAGGFLKGLESGGRLVCLCGPGNNGGDVLALIYMLLSHRPDLKKQIRLFRSGNSKTETAGFYSKRIEELGIESAGPEQFAGFAATTDDLIIEALLGTGQTSAPRGAILEMLVTLGKLRNTPAPPRLISLDVPTGLRENAPVRFVPPGGEVNPLEDIFPSPDEIHSYGVEKAVLHLHLDLALHCKIHTLPMGFHPLALEEVGPLHHHLLDGEKTSARLFLKPQGGHKYEAGHGLLVGGSPSMEGAALMAADSFFASGGGILHLLLGQDDPRLRKTVERPAIMFLDREGFIPDRLHPGSIGIGPGLSASDLEELEQPLLEWLRRAASRYRDQNRSGPAIVLDAGATRLALHPDYPEELRERTLLTPHSGEWHKLGGPRPDSLQALDRAREWNVHHCRTNILIKGPVSVLLQAPDRAGCSRAFIHSRPNPSLATAGSGDVLTGILLAVFSRAGNEQLTVAEICSRALWLHDRSARRLFHPSADSFPEAIRVLLAESHAPQSAGE